jgi:hypothetical protein
MWHSVSGFFSRPKKQSRRKIEYQPCKMTVHNLSEVPIESRALALDTISCLPKSVSQEPVVTSSQWNIARPPLGYAPPNLREGGIKRQFPEGDLSSDKSSHKRFNAGCKDNSGEINEVQRENDLRGNSDSTIIQDIEKLKSKPISKHKLTRLEAKARARKSDSDSNLGNRDRRSESARSEESSVERDIEEVKDDIKIKNPQCCKVHNSLSFVKSEIDKMDQNIRNIIDEKLSEFIEVKKLNFKDQMERSNRIKNMFLKKKKTVDVEIQADIQIKPKSQKETDLDFEEPIPKSKKPILTSAVPSMTEGLLGKKEEPNPQAKSETKPPILRPTLPIPESKPSLEQPPELLGKSDSPLFDPVSAKPEEKGMNKNATNLLTSAKATEAKDLFSGGSNLFMGLASEKKPTPSESVKDAGATPTLIEEKPKAPEVTSSSTWFPQLLSKPASTEKQPSLFDQGANKLFLASTSSMPIPVSTEKIVFGDPKIINAPEQPATSNPPSSKPLLLDPTKKPEEKSIMDAKTNPFLSCMQNSTPSTNQLFGRTTQPNTEPQGFFGASTTGGLFPKNFNNPIFGKPPDNNPATQGSPLFSKLGSGSLFGTKIDLPQTTTQPEPQTPKASSAGSVFRNTDDNKVVFGGGLFGLSQPQTSLFNTNDIFAESKPFSSPVPLSTMSQSNTGGLFIFNHEPFSGKAPMNNQLFGEGSSIGLGNQSALTMQNPGGLGNMGVTNLQMGPGLLPSTQASNNLFTLGKKKKN